jgi:hypothetical protein
MKQRQDESLSDYTKHFKSAREGLESHIGGPVELIKYAKGMDGYDENDLDAMEECYEKANEQFMAYIYLNDANKSKYGSILKGLSTQHSLGQDQYPKTLYDATSVLSNHKWDSYQDKNRTKKDNKKNQDGE